MPYPDSGVSSPLPHRFDSDSGLWRLGGTGRAAGAVSCAAHGAHCGLNAGQVWNLCVVALFAALVGQRLLLVILQLERSAPSSLVDAGAGHDSSSAAGRRAGALAGVGGCRAVCALAAAAACGTRPMRWPRLWRWGWRLSNWARCWRGRVTGRRLRCAGLLLIPILWLRGGAGRRWAFRCIRCRRTRPWLF